MEKEKRKGGRDGTKIDNRFIKNDDNTFIFALSKWNSLLEKKLFAIMHFDTAHLSDSFKEGDGGVIETFEYCVSFRRNLTCG